MSEQPGASEPHVLRNLWVGFGTAVLIAALYVGYTMWSRRSANAELAEKQRAAQSAKQRESDAAAVEELGGNEFKIMAFYASPGIVHRGETVEMCYGVSNTKAVRLDPPEANLWPSANHCMQVRPKKTTLYTLTAEDGNGNAKTAQLTIQVR